MIKSVFLAATGAVLALGMAASASAQSAQPASTQTCAAIPANAADLLFNQWNAAWATRNPDTVTNLFTRDAVLSPTVSNRIRTDRAGIRDYFVGFLANSPVARINSSTIKPGCNEMTRMGSWSVDLTNPQTQARSTVTGRYTFIYRYEDGQWKVAHLHSSLNPEAAPAVASTGERG